MGFHLVISMLHDLSDKQQEAVFESNARLNIWEGAVRSGKSFSSLIRWIHYIKECPRGVLIAIGRNQDTIKRNIVDPMLELLGIDVKYYYGRRELSIWGKTIYLVGASDDRAQGRIQGNTYVGAYVDEICLLPVGFFKMLLSRLSLPEAKLFGTTNPDSPFHWLKTEYLDRKDLDLKVFKFNLDDNPSLTDKFKDNLKKEYTGLWYKRYIEGAWTLAEGTVYDFFDEALHVIDLPPGLANSYLVGIDYGTTNPCAFVLIGHNPSLFPNLWVEKEYYYDSAKEMRQKTDSEYADDLRKFIDGYPIESIYIDPSAVSFKTELRHLGVDNLRDAKNDVLDGIRFVSKFLSNGTLKICSRCKTLIKEMYSYSWDEVSHKLGVDKPRKENDHCFAKGTQVLTVDGNKNIEDIKENDFVITPLGPKKVLKTFCHQDDVYEYSILGKKIRCTSNHKFFTINGWKESSFLIDSDMFLIDIQEEKWKTSLCLTEENIEGIHNPKIVPIEDIIERINQIALKDLDISIEMFGNSIMEKFPTDTIYITSTEIPETMILATSNLSQAINTFPNIWQIVQKSKSKLQEFLCTKSDLLQKNGTLPKQDTNGTKNMPKNHCLGQKELFIQKNVNLVEKNSKEKQHGQNFVAIVVSHNGEETIRLIMKSEYAAFVTKSLEQISTTKKDIVTAPVLANLIGKQDVYNLMVENMPVYFAENILVHNCLDALRYSIYTQWFEREGGGSLDINKWRNLKHKNSGYGKSNDISDFMRPGW